MAMPSGKRDVAVEPTSFAGRQRELADKGIAQKLVISPRTAEGHLNRLLQKLGFASRASVPAWVSERQASGH